MAKPAIVQSSDTFATWRTRYNTLRDMVPEVVESASAPTVNDDITNYENGTLWIQSNGDAFFLVDNTNGAADWLQLGATPGALLNDGTVPLTANWDVGGFDITNIDQVYVNTGIVSNDNAGALRISGGAGTGAGAEILLYGTSAVGTASDMRFYANNAVELEYDHSNSVWDFSANAITTTGALSCGAFTSTGIDDNGTGTRFTIADTLIQITSTDGYARISNSVGTGGTAIGGGVSSTDGANLVLYGPSQGTLSNDILLRTGTTNELAFDSSANQWNFQANAIATTGNINGATITASAGFSGPGGSITGVNAAQLNGATSSTAATASTVALRDASGDLDAVDLRASTAVEAGGSSGARLSVEGIEFEGRNHCISNNDGLGNFNIRVANNPILNADERCTEAGYASHWEFAQSTGLWTFNTSSASLAVDATPSWRSMMVISPDSVSLRYQGSQKLVTVSNGVSVTGNITADNIGSLAAKDFWSGTQASYDGIGTKDANTIYFIT